jgi:MarR-like DNA-binding transcriptional regulator SgrR of sgrS sRNA
MEQELALEEKTFSFFRVIILFVALFFGIKMQKCLAMNTLKVSISPTYPLDPSKIKSMADYDLALCLHRTWFEYDDKRTAIPSLISSWTFDQKEGNYRFVVSSRAMWSDGSQLTGEQLIENLKRLINQKNSYGNAIDAIVDINKAKIINASEFTLPTRNKKPSEAFFQRMGSIFLSVVHPSSWNKAGIFVNNNITIGPYKTVKETKDELFLEKNSFDRLAFENRIQNIHIKRPSEVVNLEEFLNGNSFADIIQTYTLMPKELYQKILEKKLPFWTRAFDRVSYLAPIHTYNEKNNKLRNFLLIVGKLLREKSSNELIPQQVHLASSLQPIGYPLFEPINYSALDIATTKLPAAISIVGISGNQFDLQKSILEEIVKRYNLPVKLQFSKKSSIPEFLKEIDPKSNFDLKLLSFGVADPEAATWLSLVLNKDGPFIELSHSDYVEFEAILRNFSGKSDEIQKLKKMLWQIGTRGSYLPLFHFSTMSLAKSPISFANIKELDETVDYSKIKTN